MALNEALQYILDRTEAAYLSDEEEESEEPNYAILGRELSLIIQSYEQGGSTPQLISCRMLMDSCQEAEEQEIYFDYHGSI